jgi:hypothetical protein
LADNGNFYVCEITKRLLGDLQKAKACERYADVHNAKECSYCGKMFAGKAWVDYSDREFCSQECAMSEYGIEEYDG